MERINEVRKPQLNLKIQIDIRKVMRAPTLYGWNETCTLHVEIMSKVNGLESKRTVRVQSKADDPEGRKQTILVKVDDPFHRI